MQIDEVGHLLLDAKLFQESLLLPSFLENIQEGIRRKKYNDAVRNNIN
jgi:hypothetical protein